MEHIRTPKVLHHHIASVEKLSLTTTGCPLVIQCRNFRVVHFELYAFSYNPKQNDQQREEGWQLIDLGAEYERMGVPCDQWQLTDVNRDFKELYAFSYNPKQNDQQREEGWQLIDLGAEYERMGVPCDQWQLTDVNRDFKGRFPVLTYFYQDKKAAVCRCSQPLSGFSARCLEDESMLQAISKANHNSRFVYVMDTRPKLNALANRAAGKGYENEDNYSNIRFQFAVTVEGASVLVHCSDGWDRTAQVCSLGALLIDPYYRTIKGFMVLIEKDWISFGHKFADRCDQLDGDPREVSPVFTQFLECVWQLTEQFPQAFEFSEWFLLQIHEHVHSCQYGNFLGNNHRQREELRLRERTHSLWAFLLGEQQNYRNPFYSSAYGKAHPVLEPSTLPYHFKSMHPRQSILKTIHTLKETSQQTAQTLQALQNQLLQLGVTPAQQQQQQQQQQRPLTNSNSNPNLLPPRPSSLILEALPISRKEAQQEEEEEEEEEVGEEATENTDTERTVEGSSGTDSRKQSYGELDGTYAVDGDEDADGEMMKAEPAVVSLEFGMARMTC
ncbi:hypothetical protein CRUP_031906 [Coryphaenoides rupestris]|nr:hypothetical protein CRUP_031906 [Coryphaenoides rupestris]